MSISIIPPSVTPQMLLSVLGVVYVHKKTGDGGDLYLTRFGLRYSDLLEIENWYEPAWFAEHRVRLAGTSAVYRCPTKQVNGRRIDLVVKNCRVGEDVPVDTRTLAEFINTEFNSPWEEFSLVMEIREGKFGDPNVAIRTQEPLGIYVPPERMQMWQSGRSIDKINRIQARHPGIAVDILRQYKLVYRWIPGRDVVELLDDFGCHDDERARHLEPLTSKAISDMSERGYAMADMKPSHIIIGEQLVRLFADAHPPKDESVDMLHRLLERGAYSIVDYELLTRTPGHEEAVTGQRRNIYLDDQKNRFVASELPEYLQEQEIMGVPYVFGHAESTGGRLWVVGRNGRLFDYFLPERWRKTHAWKLSENAEIFYTLTKDSIHVVWKPSRVGETPVAPEDDDRAEAMIEQGYNSPFEEFAVAHELSQKGIATVYVRAIYMTGSPKIERSTDTRRYQTHAALTDPEGAPILRDDHNYITLRGYFNGSDSWVARQRGQLCRPIGLDHALTLGLMGETQYRDTLDALLGRVADAGFDGSLLRGNDIVTATMPDGSLLRDEKGGLDARICNFEWIRKLPARRSSEPCPDA